MRKELVVAEKEFKDHVRSRRFLAMFSILMVLAVVGMISGMDNYHQQLDQYKQTLDRNAKDPNMAQMIASMQQELDNMTANGGDPDQIEQLKYRIEDMQQPIMPSIINIYYSMTNPFYTVGMLLAIAIGFDLITREKDEGTLKSLLSRPLYRDSVINGKAIAAIAVIAIVLAATFLISGAILLFNNIVPQGDDLARMIALYVVSLLYIVVFFAISMMVSALAKNTSMAMLVTLGIVVVLYVLPQIAYPVTTMVIGDFPQYPEFTYDPSADPQAQQQAQQQLQEQYNQQMQDYYNKQTQLNDLINGISPQYWYGQLTGAISSRNVPNQMYTSDWIVEQHKNKNMTLWQSLSYEWVGLLVIVIETVVAFAVAYAKFMRMDIR